jgi:hypothetical protein
MPKRVVHQPRSIHTLHPSKHTCEQGEATMACHEATVGTRMRSILAAGTLDQGGTGMH